jgi:hypothetical protein
MTRSLSVITLVVVLLLLPAALPSWAGLGPGDRGPGETRASWTVNDFEERDVPFNVLFERSRVNSTYHIPVPNSGTVLSASITLEGKARYSLKGFPTDFDDNPGAGHSAFYSETTTYPPTGSPTNYQTNLIDSIDEWTFANIDGSTYTTTTMGAANPPPFRYPVQLYDLKVNMTGARKLGVSWYGYGECVDNATNTHGAQLWIRNITFNKWEQLDSYAVNDTGQVVHMLEGALDAPYNYFSTYGHVKVLVYGQHDEQGPFWPTSGNVATDYITISVYKNDTLQLPRDVELAIGGGQAIWSHSGEFSSEATIGDNEGLKGALQAYVDGVPAAPGNVSVPTIFRVLRTTAGAVRVKALSVMVREVDNLPPTFLGAKMLSMTEDVDLKDAINLRDHFDDDHQGNDLDYSVEWEENASAINARIATDGYHVNLITVANDWAGELRFNFTATDVWGKSTVSDPFIVNVTQVNDPPTIEDPGYIDLQEDVPFEFTLTYRDPDLPYGDVLTFSDDTELFDIDPRTGTIAFTPTQQDVGDYIVNVTVRDKVARQASVTFDLTVSNTNDRPEIVDPGVIVALEDTYFSYNFTTTDEDIGDSATWLLVGGIGTMFVGAQNGRLTWIPTNEHVGLHNISVIAKDGHGAADQLNVTIEVLNVNDVPTLETPGLVRITEEVPFSYQLEYTDVDLEVDPEELLTFTVDPPFFEITSRGFIQYVPANDHVGQHVLNITVTDRAGASAWIHWRVEIDNVNQPPVLEMVPPQVWHEGQPVFLRVNATDPDLGEVLTFSDGTSMFAIDQATGEINFTPIQVDVGSHSIRIQVRDREGAKDTIYIEIEVRAFNDAPVVSFRVEPDDPVLDEGDLLNLAVIISDEDDDKDDISIDWYLDKEHIGFVESVVLRDLQPGHHNVTVVVSDGENTVEAYYEFDVKEVEVPFPWVSLVASIVVVVVALVLVHQLVIPQIRKGGLNKLFGLIRR